MDYKIKKLYEIAPMLSPSIYETIFYNQYQGRADKESLILDNEVFEKYYIDENIYRNFLFANSEKLGKALNYIGLNQMHSSIIKSIELKENKLKIKLLDVGIDNLANTLIELKSLKDIKVEPFYIDILFEKVDYCSNHYLDKDEILIPIEEDIINGIYTQDQITYISPNEIELVISMETEKAKSQNDNNKLRYYMLKCGSINIIDEAKEIWTKLFGDTNFNMLYDYYINLRKSNKIILDERVCMNIIQKYKQFILDLDFF